MKRTFWETAYRMYLTRVRNAVFRRAATGSSRERMGNHLVTADCAIVAAEHAVPPGVELMIASEMAAVRDRAKTSKILRVHRRSPWYAGAVMVFLSGQFVHEIVRPFSQHFQQGLPWTAVPILRPLFMTGVVLAAWSGVGFMLGERRIMDRLCADWASRLDGKWGSDVLDEVITWLDTRWAWLLPPNLFANDVLWAVGTRRGAPVLAVLERCTGSVVFSLASGGSARRGGARAADGYWTRCNVFIHGARFRDAEHRERLRATLTTMGGGAVQCPNGVYLYGAFRFLRFFREEDPTSEIWIDLVDRVLDPDYPGSEAAAKEIHRELVLSDLAAPQGRLHA